MTKILKDRGFVLKKKKFRETSKLITIFAENAGKINLVAKGVRTPKSKTSAVLEPLNLIEFVYYDKPTRDLQYISSAEFIDDFSNIKSDYEKIKIAYAVIELTNYFSHEGQVNNELFDLVYNTLVSLDKNQRPNFNLFIDFIIKLCEISGYPAYTGECPSCHKPIDLMKDDFQFTRNYGVICLNCKNYSNSLINLDSETKKMLALFLSGQVSDEEYSEKFKHLYLPLLEFLQYHVEEIKRLKSLELF
ncbi:MAG: DNA repair protein RecO [Ignavibacteria bacterium]|nr:DNA repair protein RecO [Ignavibacteria bacterium]